MPSRPSAEFVLWWLMKSGETPLRSSDATRRGFGPLGSRAMTIEVMQMAGLLAFGRGRELKFATWNKALEKCVASSDRYYREGYVMWWLQSRACPIAACFDRAGMREWTDNLLQLADLRDVATKRRRKTMPGEEPSEEQEICEQASYGKFKDDFIETPKGD